VKAKINGVIFIGIEYLINIKINSFLFNKISLSINLYFFTIIVSMRNKIIFSILVFFGIIFAYNYAYPDHRSISDEVLSFTIKADDIHNEFSVDASQAELKYLDQTVLVSGIVTAIGSKSVTISNKIYCQFETLNSDLKVNDSIAVKGRCIGFDDLLEEIKLDQCSIK